MLLLFHQFSHWNVLSLKTWFIFFTFFPFYLTVIFIPQIQIAKKYIHSENNHILFERLCLSLIKMEFYLKIQLFYTNYNFLFFDFKLTLQTQTRQFSKKLKASVILRLLDQNHLNSIHGQRCPIFVNICWTEKNKNNDRVG